MGTGSKSRAAMALALAAWAFGPAARGHAQQDAADGTANGAALLRALGPISSGPPRIGSVQAEGALDEAAARAALDRLDERLRRCGRNRDDARGSLRLRLLVVPNGRVTAVTLEGGALRGDDAEAVQRCVERTLMRARFEASDAGAHATVRARVWVGSEANGLLGNLGSVPSSALGSLGGFGVAGGGLGLSGGAGSGGAGSGGAGSGSAGSGGAGSGSAGSGGAGSGSAGSGGAGSGARSPSAGRLRIGRGTTVRGPLDPQVVRRVLRTRRHAIRYCFDRALRADPSIHGRVVVAFVIGPDGRVSATNVHANTLNDELASCVTRALRRVHFPRPEGAAAVVVRYPLELRASSTP